MADLITLDNVIDAIGRSPANASEESRWAHYIEQVSTYINSQANCSFTPFVDVTERFQADHYGIIDTLLGPVSTVTSIVNYKTQEPDLDAEWDGMTTIAKLKAHQVVDITYSGGYSIVPDDIRMVTLDAVVTLIEGPGYGSITTYQIGDVVEKYNGAFTARDVVEDLGSAVLDRYRDSEWTWRLGDTSFPDFTTGMPTL